MTEAYREPMVPPLAADDPESVGPYALLARLGAGGFGRVYLARRRDGASSGLVALKVLHAGLADRRRFRQEINGFTHARGPTMPRVLDCDVDAERPWLAAEHVPGPSLQQVVERCGALPPPAVWWIGAGTAAALRRIHDAGLVHRDLQPRNILLVRAGSRVIDFGLAHMIDEPHNLTMSRMFVGTLAYAAPEQAESLANAGRAADVFGLGATVLFAATGHPPHEAGPDEDLYQKVRFSQPDLCGLSPADELFDMVTWCLARAEQQRPSAADICEEFERHVRRYHGGAFADVLPRNVLAVLDAYEREIADAVGTRRGPDGDGPPTRVLPRLTPAPPGGGSDGNAANDAHEGVPHHREQACAPSRQAQRPGGGLSPKPWGLGCPHGSGLRWSHDVGDWIRAPVVVAADIVVAAAVGGTVCGIEASTGQRLWTARLGARVTGGAALAGHVLYVGDHHGSVHAVDLGTGRHATLARVDGPVLGAPVLGDRTLFVPGGETLFAVDIATGRTRWGLPTGGQIPASPLAMRDAVYVGGGDGALHAVDPATGGRRWRVPTDGQIAGAPADAGGAVLVAATDGVVRAVDPAHGGVLRTRDLGAPIHAAPVVGAFVHVGATDGVVAALDPRTLDQRWRRTLDDEVSALALAEDGLCVSGASGVLHVLDAPAAGGSVRRRYPTGGMISAPATAYGRALLVGSLDGAVYCWDR